MRCTLLLMIIWFGIAHGQQHSGITFRNLKHDFGSFTENNGPVSTRFTFKNNTMQPIKIKTVESTCGCTITDWSKESILPNKEGQIKAVFNPEGRPGFFNKSIIVTFLPDSTPITLQIRGNVSTQKSTNEILENINGNLKTRSASFHMGKVYFNQPATFKTFSIFNSGNEPVKIKQAELPGYFSIKYPEEIRPGELATLSLKRNIKTAIEFGFHTDQLILFTNDSDNPVKHFSILYTIEEFFPILEPDELKNSPKLTLSHSEIKFSGLRNGVLLEREILIKNTGKELLQIRSIVPNCSCLEAFIDQRSINPDASGKIKLRFNPGSRTGRQIKSVMIYSNDPINPVQKISLNVLITD